MKPAISKKRLPWRPFDHIAQAQRNRREFLESVRLTLPQMTDKQIIQLVSYLAKEADK